MGIEDKFSPASILQPLCQMQQSLVQYTTGLYYDACVPDSLSLFLQCHGSDDRLVAQSRSRADPRRLLEPPHALEHRIFMDTQLLSRLCKARAARCKCYARIPVLGLSLEKSRKLPQQRLPDIRVHPRIQIFKYVILYTQRPAVARAVQRAVLQQEHRLIIAHVQIRADIVCAARTYRHGRQVSGDCPQISRDITDRPVACLLLCGSEYKKMPVAERAVYILFICLILLEPALQTLPDILRPADLLYRYRIVKGKKYRTPPEVRCHAEPPGICSDLVLHRSGMYDMTCQQSACLRALVLRQSGLIFVFPADEGFYISVQRAVCFGENDQIAHEQTVREHGADGCRFFLFRSFRIAGADKISDYLLRTEAQR